MVNSSNQALLKSVAFKINVLREAEKKFSNQLAPNFNLFYYLRTDEVGLSRVLADLLDPNGRHGQGYLFLDALSRAVGQEWVACRCDWRVTLERQANGQRRIDIFMESKAGIIGIENKPWASDQINQLSDYANVLSRWSAGRNFLLIYFGNYDPSGESINVEKREELRKSGNYIRLTFHGLATWLDECASKTKAIVVRVFVEDLAKFVRGNINGELEMSEENEIITEICKSPENIESAFNMVNAMSALKKSLLEKFRSDLDSKLKEKGFHLVWDDGMTNNWRSCVGFGVKFSEQDLYLRIEFEGSGLYNAIWGIRRVDENVNKDMVLWGAIKNKMDDIFGEGWRSSDWWPCWRRLDNNFELNFFGPGFVNWGISEKPWIMINEGELSKKIVVLAEKVYEAFEGNIDLLLSKPKF